MKQNFDVDACHCNLGLTEHWAFLLYAFNYNYKNVTILFVNMNSSSPHCSVYGMMSSVI